MFQKHNLNFILCPTINKLKFTRIFEHFYFYFSVMSLNLNQGQQNFFFKNTLSGTVLFGVSPVVRCQVLYLEQPDDGSTCSTLVLTNRNAVEQD